MRLTLLHIVLIKTTAVLFGGAGILPSGWALVLFFGADLWVLYHLFVPHASGLVRTFTRFETTRDEVWLTIDDGPDDHDTPIILDLLDRHRARATFFLIGQKAAQHPALVAEIACRGHEIAHHTHTHPSASFWCATPSRVNRELDLAFAPLTPPGAPRPHRFRAPVGIKNLFLAPALAERNLACIGWSVRSADTFSRDPQKVSARVLRTVRPGAILLLHEGPCLHASVRVHALAGVLDALASRGLRCVIPTDAQLR